MNTDKVTLRQGFKLKRIYSNFFLESPDNVLLGDKYVTGDGRVVKLNEELEDLFTNTDYSPLKPKILIGSTIREEGLMDLSALNIAKGNKQISLIELTSETEPSDFYLKGTYTLRDINNLLYLYQVHCQQKYHTGTVPSASEWIYGILNSYKTQWDCEIEFNGENIISINIK